MFSVNYLELTYFIFDYLKSFVAIAVVKKEETKEVF